MGTITSTGKRKTSGRDVAEAVLDQGLCFQLEEGLFGNLFLTGFFTQVPLPLMQRDEVVHIKGLEKSG
jgi:hypothetical protein